MGLRGLITASVDEGWADHNVLRYAMFRDREASRRPHDSTFSHTFLHDHWRRHTRSHNVLQRYHNGESAPIGRNGVTEPLTYRPWKPGSPCHGNSPNANEYDCGSVIGAVYWTLAWNEIRVGFNGMAPGLGLLTTSPYTSDPERLANIAFTYAIAASSRNAGVAEFFDRVSERYSQFQRRGWITGAERHRINQVLTAACVGWSGHVCQTRHVTTDGVLPVMYTRHESLSPAIGSKEFIRAQTFTPRGGAQMFVFADGWNDTPVAKYAEIRAGQFIEKSFVVPADGNYRIQMAANSYAACCNGVWAEVDGVRRFWAINRTGDWTWYRDGPTFNLNAGWHTLRIRGLEKTKIEAVLIERVP